MNGKIAAVSAAIMMIGSLTRGYAADMDDIVKKASPASSSPAAPATCTDISNFFLTDCQLSAYGVRLYGTIDMGYGYQTHTAPFNGNYASGIQYLLSKNGRSPMWARSPDALSASNVGIAIKEPLASGWSFIGRLQTGFNPYSLQVTNAQQSMIENRGVPLNQQTANADSSYSGQFYNGLGFFGVSSDTYGTLTVFRQTSLMADGVAAYDPMRSSFAFSAVGFSGQASGGGDGEDSKFTSAVKYRVDLGGVHLGALAMLGGYDWGNGAKAAYQGNLGGDIRVGPGVLSLDGIGGYLKDAVSLSLGGTAVTQTPLTASLYDTKNVMALARYTVNRLKLYAGYEWMEFSPPSDPITVGGFPDIAGSWICAGCTNINATNITNVAYSASNGTKDKILQIMWVGARYSVTDSLDLAVAYYHNAQTSYAASTANILNCAKSSESQSYCGGTTDVFSVLADWKFAAKWDTYIGMTYSAANGGLSSGYLARNDLGTTAGVRFRW
jgi:predicted porin